MPTKLTMQQFMARVAHQCWRSYIAGIDFEMPGEPTSAQMASAEAGCAAYLADPNITPEQMHARWMKFKLEQGWKFGPVKDEAKKEHPNLTAYNELSGSEQRKDEVFMAACKTAVDLWIDMNPRVNA